MQKTLEPKIVCLSHISRLWRSDIAMSAIMLWLLCGSAALAVDNKKPVQADSDNSKVQDEFLPTPLDITEPDPLLPRPLLDEPLSSTELRNLAATLSELEAQANAKLQTGDKEGALAIWNRELRLRRLLGPLEEVNALGRVGNFAWSAGNREELRAITQRLQILQQQAQFLSPVEPTLLAALGQAYQQVRTPEQALSVYDQILAITRLREDPAAIEATLKTIAELYVSKFDYIGAVAVYEELLGSARAKGDRSAEVLYMKQLADVYDQSRQFEESVSLKQQLAEYYLNEKEISQIPKIRLEIASNYESLGKVEEAFRNYQEAYSTAWSLQQYARASDALRRLVALYRSQNQLNETLETSKILLESERLGGDSYGMMNTYDQIAQIQAGRSNYTEALAAYQSGLELAQELGVQQEYFANQISQVKQKISKQTAD